MTQINVIKTTNMKTVLKCTVQFLANLDNITKTDHTTVKKKTSSVCLNALISIRRDDIVT
jgi:hypothetical protein